ncbi:protein AF-9 isoform X1 [Nerophis lumbriciformis]|uniref:protein AF-9 isoform X1 n=2 Tax=Nerophis lumbriciformis TaxID=546530 RepID=UPI002AE03450|nr:protein AF-9-like isoform X1 [Nerophis lumbriciformis]XP_061816071.1 protein AF-9-like isoform X1 [Nerophis lumbriciformis]
MANSGAVQVKLELGHRAQFRKKPTVEGFTHDWMVFVRGPEHSNIQHFVEKVVFHLHESFPKPKRVCKDPPYKVEESGYAGFILPIEVYFRNKEEPKKVRFDYDLFLHLEGHPPVNHLRCEKLTFNSPAEDFRRKLLRAGGQRDPHKRTSEDSKVMVMQEGSTSLFGHHMKLPMLPNTSLMSPFPDSRKSKSSLGSKDISKGSGGTLLTTATTTTSTTNSSSSFSKLHKPCKDHKDKPAKDLKETKSALRDSSLESSKAPKEPSKKPKENQPLRDINPKMGFKEPKSMSNHGSGPNKRLSASDADNRVTKKSKKGFADSSVKQTDAQHADKKLLKERSQMRSSKLHPEGEQVDHRKLSTLPPFHEVVDHNDSDMESAKSDSEQPSPVSSSSSSGFGPTHHRRQVLGPLQSVMQDLHSDDDDNDSEDDDDLDLDSDAERPAHTHLTHHQRRVSLSDGSESDSSAPSPPSRNDVPGLLKTTNNQILEVKSPKRHSKQDKSKNVDCDKAYLDELVELHKRLMTLREGHILQQIVNLIEETGHFHITNTTFDFDLCSLDRSTVRKLQSYLETSGLS